MSNRDTMSRAKDRLPRKAYAITGYRGNPDTWKLPHHKKGMTGSETVDWKLMEVAVAALSSKCLQGKKVSESPEEILKAARHLADHYIEAEKPLPDILAALT